MPDKKIVFTEAEIAQVLTDAGHPFIVGASIRKDIAEALNKKLNPPAWTVATTQSKPVIYYRGSKVQLHVYSGTGTSDPAGRLHIAEMVAECLNTRGLEIEQQ